MFKKSLLVLALFSFGAQADICEDINDLSNDWNEVANFVNDVERGDYFTDRELNQLENYVADLSEGTFILADALIDLGNNREARLGSSMNEAMNDLRRASGQDEIVDSLDYLVDVLDQTTDYCDVQ